MNNKKKKILYTKMVILIICFFIIARIFTLVLSKYESVSSSIADVDVAIYLLHEDYKTMAINLDSLFPREDAFVYNFSIGNQKDSEIAEVNLIYDLTIKTTTNLPLTYELYMNENYTSPGSKCIIKNDVIEQDENGTYFRILTTPEITLKYTEGVTNLYQLVIKFPQNYNKEEYQDILEMIEIEVDAKQVI